MPQDLSFDKPVYSDEMFKGQQMQSPSNGMGGGFSDSAKPLLGKIIPIIIVIIIAYLGYWFFVGSYQQVRVTVSGMDGFEIDSVSGEISQNGNKIADVSRVSQTLSLKAGTYDISLTAEGFKSFSDSFDVSDTEKSYTAQLSKDISAKIDSITIADNNSDNKLFAQADNSLLISLSNNSETDAEVELVKDSPSDNVLTAEFGNPSIIVPKQSQDILVPVTVKINSNYKVSNRTTGDKQSLKFRIKGTRVLLSKDFQVIPKMQVTISPTTLRLGNIKANNVASAAKEITIQNKEQFALEGNVNFSVTVQASGNSSDSEAAGWFSFYPEITELAKGESVKESVSLTIPSTAGFPEGQDSFPLTGTINIFGDSWMQKVKFDAVVQKMKVFINTPTITPTSFSMNSSQIKTAELSLTNNSDAVLSNVSVNVEESCVDTYLTTEDSLQISSLPNRTPENSKKIIFKVKAPEDAPVGDPKICNITVTYEDPLNPGGEPVSIDVPALRITRTV